MLHLLICNFSVTVLSINLTAIILLYPKNMCKGNLRVLRALRIRRALRALAHIALSRYKKPVSEFFMSQLTDFGYRFFAPLVGRVKGHCYNRFIKQCPLTVRLDSFSSSLGSFFSSCTRFPSPWISMTSREIFFIQLFTTVPSSYSSSWLCTGNPRGSLLYSI